VARGRSLGADAAEPAGDRCSTPSRSFLAAHRGPCRGASTAGLIVSLFGVDLREEPAEESGARLVSRPARAVAGPSDERCSETGGTLEGMARQSSGALIAHRPQITGSARYVRRILMYVP